MTVFMKSRDSFSQQPISHCQDLGGLTFDEPGKKKKAIWDFSFVDNFLLRRSFAIMFDFCKT